MIIVRCFSLSDKHGQTSNVFDSPQHGFLIFQLKVVNKKPLLTTPASTRIEISCQKDIIFHGYKIL